MRRRLDEGVLAEIAEIAGWYEEKAAGLGTTFLDCLEATFLRIERFPERYPRVHKDARRATVTRFPQLVIYAIRDDVLVILAVLHAARHPRRWKRRV